MILVGAALFMSAAVIMSGIYRKISFSRDRVITVGVFSDSYWEVQNGYSYQILEDAIAV